VLAKKEEEEEEEEEMNATCLFVVDTPERNNHNKTMSMCVCGSTARVFHSATMWTGGTQSQS